MIANQQIQKNTGSVKNRLTSNHPVHLTMFVVLSYIVLWFPSLFEFCKCVLVRSCIAFKNSATNYFSILRILTSISVPAISIATSRIIKDSILKIYQRKSRDNRWVLSSCTLASLWKWLNNIFIVIELFHITSLWHWSCLGIVVFWRVSQGFDLVFMCSICLGFYSSSFSGFV